MKLFILFASVDLKKKIRSCINIATGSVLSFFVFSFFGDYLGIATLVRIIQHPWLVNDDTVPQVCTLISGIGNRGLV